MVRDRIYISVCGEGFGHASRAIAVAKELLSRDHDVILGSYGYVYDYLKKLRLCKTVKIPKELAMRGENGEFNIKKTFFSTLKILLTKYRTLIDREKKIMKNYRITCVISDGRISPIIAGSYHMELPVLFVTNMLTIKKSVMNNKIREFFKPSFSFVGKVGSVLLDEIIIPDFPPPDTICYYLLPRMKRTKKKTTFVGPVVKKQLYRTNPKKMKKKMVLVLVGGHGYREPLIDTVIKASDLNKNYNFIAISRLIKKHVKKDNLELLPFVDNIYSYLKSSDFVISQSGHSTVMEMICSGKTGIMVPDKKQYEQEAIARRLKKMKLFKTMSYDNLNPKKLIRNLDILAEDKNYKKNVVGLSKLAKELNGPRKIADLAIEYSSRMTMRY